jgi:cysteine desulfurase / selenocysteine lyase
MLAFLQAAARHGTTIQLLPEDAEGELDIDALRSLLLANSGGGGGLEAGTPPESQSQSPVLIALSHIPTSSGRVLDAAAIGAVAAEARVPFLLDACQSAGQLPLDVQALRCDFLTGAHVLPCQPSEFTAPLLRPYSCFFVHTSVIARLFCHLSQ